MVNVKFMVNDFSFFHVETFDLGGGRPHIKICLNFEIFNTNFLLLSLIRILTAHLPQIKNFITKCYELQHLRTVSISTNCQSAVPFSKLHRQTTFWLRAKKRNKEADERFGAMFQNCRPLTAKFKIGIKME